MRNVNNSKNWPEGANLSCKPTLSPSLSLYFFFSLAFVVKQTKSTFLRPFDRLFTHFMALLCVLHFSFVADNSAFSALIHLQNIANTIWIYFLFVNVVHATIVSSLVSHFDEDLMLCLQCDKSTTTNTHHRQPQMLSYHKTDISNIAIIYWLNLQISRLARRWCSINGYSKL